MILYLHEVVAQDLIKKPLVITNNQDF